MGFYATPEKTFGLDVNSYGLTQIRVAQENIVFYDNRWTDLSQVVALDLGQKYTVYKPVEADSTIYSMSGD